jgi:hypothetical protein
LNLVTDNRIKEISLIYDLSVLFQLDKEKSEIMKKLRIAKQEQEDSKGEENQGTPL